MVQSNEDAILLRILKITLVLWWPGILLVLYACAKICAVQFMILLAYITLNFESQDGRSLQIVVQKEVSNCILLYKTQFQTQKKTLFSSFSVWKRGWDHMWKRSIWKPEKTGYQCLETTVHPAFEIRNCFWISLIECNFVCYRRTQQVMWYHQFCQSVMFTHHGFRALCFANWSIICYDGVRWLVNHLSHVGCVQFDFQKKLINRDCSRQICQSLRLKIMCLFFAERGVSYITQWNFQSCWRKGTCQFIFLKFIWHWHISKIHLALDELPPLRWDYPMKTDIQMHVT